MKSRSMSATEFKIELKRLDFGQSAFAKAADVPLRTVQSWATGERNIPRTASALIEKVERMSNNEKLAAKVVALPTEKRKAAVKLIELMSDLSKELRRLKEQNEQRISELTKVKADIDRLNKTCVFQAEKITAYEQDLRRRASAVVPFNA